MGEAGSPLSTEESDVEYGLVDGPPLDEAIRRRIQHVSAMPLGTVAPPPIRAGAEK